MCILERFLLISMTSRLNLLFKNYVLPVTILSIGLVAFVYVDVILLTLFRPRSLT